MKICRYRDQTGVHYGELQGDRLSPLDGPPWTHPPSQSRMGPKLSDVELLVPVEASKVVCVGQNYRKHAEEMGKPIPAEPLLFLKPSTALNATGRPIQIPPASQEVHHEAELGLVIGKRLKNATEAEATLAIVALTCINDVTARDIQRREIQHTRAKSYDTFACAGPWMVTTDALSPLDLRVQAFVNGERRQDGRTSDMIFPPARLVSFISRIMTLLPGDLISTGTPSGVGPIRSGDVVRIEVEGIGTLENPVEMSP